MSYFFSPSKIKIELPSKKIVKEEPVESDSKSNDLEHDESGLNGIKRKRPNPNSDVPEIPPKGIFSSGLFKSYLASEHSPLKISPTKRSKKPVSQNFHKSAIFGETALYWARKFKKSRPKNSSNEMNQFHGYFPFPGRFF